MKTFSKIIILLLIFSVFVWVLSCDTGGEGDTTNYYGDPDDDDDSSDDDDNDGADDDTNVDDDDDDDDDDDMTDDDDDSVPSTLSGRILPFPRTNEFMGEVDLTVIDNVTNEPFAPPVTATTDEDGYFTLHIPTGLPQVVGLKMFGDAIPTEPYIVYAFDLEVGTTDIELRFPEATFFGLLGIWGMPALDSRGHAFGIVEWEGTTNSEPVGCATVSPDRNPGADEGLTYPVDDSTIFWERSDTDPETGLFVATNYTPDDYAFEADAGNTQTLSPVHPLNAGTWTFVRIIYSVGDYPANPTPGSCQ